MKNNRQRNLLNKKFDKLLVIEMCGNDEKGRHFKSKVQCDCGNVETVLDTLLINGRKTQCRECAKKSSKKYKHGMTNTSLFNIWHSMKQRCYDRRNNSYNLYGNRGIIICEEWKNDFLNFYSWAMENGYKKGLSIDRIDVDGNYEPSNCRWANTIEQANNKRNNIIIEYNGIKDTLPNWARKVGINKGILQYRYYHKWDVERMLTIKPKLGRNQYNKD